MEREDLNTQISLVETNLPTKVGSDQPSTQTNLPTKVGLNQPSTKESSITHDMQPTKPKQSIFPTKPYPPVLQQPPFLVGTYNTHPSTPTSLPPIPVWNHPYKHVKSKVGSYRTN